MKKLSMPVRIALAAVIIAAAAAAALYLTFRYSYERSNFVRDEDVQIDSERAAQTQIVVQTESELEAEVMSALAEQSSSGVYSLLLICSPEFAGSEEETEDMLRTESAESEFGSEAAEVSEAALVSGGGGLLPADADVSEDTGSTAENTAESTAMIPAADEEPVESVAEAAGDLTDDADFPDSQTETLTEEMTEETEDVNVSPFFLLMTVNSNVDTVYLTYITPELYVVIPEIGSRRLADACSIGGGPMAVAALETTYQLTIDNYAAFDPVCFESFMEEIGARDPRQPSGEDPDEAEQVRERASAARQNLYAITDALAGLGADRILSVTEDYLSQVTHNLTKTDIYHFLKLVPMLADFKVSWDSIPDEDFTIEDRTVIVDIESTVAALYGELYAVEPETGESALE